MDLILALGFLDESLDSIVALGHLSRRDSPLNYSCASFSTALQMYLVALDEYKDENWNFFLQKPGIMIASQKGGRDTLGFFSPDLLKEANPSINLLKNTFIRNSKEFGWQRVASIDKLREKIEFSDGNFENVLLNAFFWVVNNLVKNGEMAIRYYLFRDKIKDKIIL